MIFSGSTVIENYTVTPPLDLLAGADMAFSLRLLRSAYTGFAVKVRRSIDNAELDIGFSGGDFDTDTLTLFAGSTGNAFVTTFYDQSGNGFNFTQTDALYQPTIYTAGKFLTRGGKPTIHFKAAYLVNNSVRFTGDVSSWFVTLAGTPGEYGGIITNKVPGGDDSGAINFDFRQLYGTWGFRQVFQPSPFPTQLFIGNFFSISGSDNMKLFTNNILNAQNTQNGGQRNTGTTWMGTYRTNEFFGVDHFLSEFMNWRNNQTAQRELLNNNLRSYYGTY